MRETIFKEKSMIEKLIKEWAGELRELADRDDVSATGSRDIDIEPVYDGRTVPSDLKDTGDRTTLIIDTPEGEWELVRRTGSKRQYKTYRSNNAPR